MGAFRTAPVLRPIRVAARPVAGPVAAPGGFEALAREHGDAVRAFALRLAGNPADAHDLAQDCLERALKRFGTFTPGTNARAWLFTILHHAFVDRCRRRAAEGRRDDIDALDIAMPEPVEPPAWTSLTSEQLARAVDRLDADFRSVFRMHAEGRSYQEIATHLGIPVNTVGTRLSRARGKLRVLLEGALGEGTP